MKKYIILTLSIMFTFPILQAQEVNISRSVISSAGSYSESENLSLSWTLGEIAVSTLEGDNMTLTQGFQQGSLGGVGFKLEEISWNISAYPNPVKDELKIQFDLLEQSDFIIEIQDVSGRLIGQKKHDEVLSGDVILINTSSYKYGVYFFKVYTPDRKQMRVLSIRKI